MVLEFLAGVEINAGGGGRLERGSGSRVSCGGGQGYQSPDRSLTFKGNFLEMNGCVFQYRSETAGPKQVPVTLEKILHFVSRTLKPATDLGPIFHNFITTIPNPFNPENKEYTVDAAIFDEAINGFVKQHSNLKENLKK